MALVSGGVVPLQGHMSQAEFDALGYPKVPDHWTEEWLAEQVAQEKVDPRVNPNLLLEETDQEFWNNVARKPLAKAILRTEQFWTERRHVWLRQYERVELGNMVRNELAAELSDESIAPEAKRIAASVLRYRIGELALAQCLREARALDVPLADVLQNPERLHTLRALHLQLDQGGAAAAAALLEEFSARMEVKAEEVKALLEEREKLCGRDKLSDSDTMAKRMNMAQKCRKDGYIEWHKGNVEEAFASWTQAEAYLRRVRLPERDAAGNVMIDEIHSLLLKNIAQAALQMQRFREALEASDAALMLDRNDLKAWYRRACALEGLGQYEEADEALKSVEDLAVGRPDRARLEKDVSQRRVKVAVLLEEARRCETKALTRACARGVFSSGRVEDQGDEALGLPETPGPAGTSQSSTAPAPVEAPNSTAFEAGDRVLLMADLADVSRGQRGTVVDVDADGDLRLRLDGESELRLLFAMDLENLRRLPAEDQAEAGSSSPLQHLQEERGEPIPIPALDKLLTREGALELLEDLHRAYGDTGFQLQLGKLARDVRWDPHSFTRLLPGVALHVQKPVLERWGFEPSLEGVEDMRFALEEHLQTADEPADGPLQEAAEKATRLLHGPMYELLFGNLDTGRGFTAG